MDNAIVKQDMNTPIVQEEQQLFTDVCCIINEARRHVATYVNEEACLMNWRVGKRIKEVNKAEGEDKQAPIR